jgi:hypothetical protein
MAGKNRKGTNVNANQEDVWIYNCKLSPLQTISLPMKQASKLHVASLILKLL